MHSQANEGRGCNCLQEPHIPSAIILMDLIVAYLPLEEEASNFCRPWDILLCY